jgi:hypothetical protein
MRLPLPAVLAVLAVAAAGSVMLTVTYRAPHYVIDARGLAVGQSMTVTLSYVPYRIYILSNVTVPYDVKVSIAGAWVERGGALVRSLTVSAYGNETIAIGPVVRVDGPVSCNITVTRRQVTTAAT